MRRSVEGLWRALSVFVATAWCSVAADAQQRVVVADFEDVGTWRAVANTGSVPGAWFAGAVWMSGTREVAFNGECAGEIRFEFDHAAEGPRRLAFRRAKMSLVSGFIDGVEFDADARGHAVSLRFALVDSANRRHMTPAVSLDKKGWARYRVDLSEAAWPEASKVSHPSRLEEVVLVASEGGRGSVFLDDLALTGAFSRKDRISLFPLYSGINYEPGRPSVLRYRARNAGEALPGAEFSLSVFAPDGREVHRAEASADLPSKGERIVGFTVPGQPAGAYEAILRVRAPGGVETVYDDTLAVFTPNGGRVNRRGMWFGVQDTTIWNGAPENALHLEWMRAVGIDLIRLDMTGTRFDPERPRSLEAWADMIAPFAEAGIDILALYQQLPARLAAKGNVRGTPKDMAEFELYAAEFGGFLGRFGNVRYAEFWNEPDIAFFHGSLEEYWEMFAAFSRGVRSAAPGIRLTTGGSTVMHPREKPGFSRSLYSENGDIYDVAAFHAHGGLGAYVERQRMVEGWQAEGGLEKMVANTESGERSGYDARGRAAQAATLVKKMAYSKSRPRSEFHVWFTLQDYWDMDPTSDDSFGLVTSDNRAKPSLVAYNEVIRRLANTDPAPAPDFPAGVSGHAFVRDDGGHVLVCWGAEGTGGGALWLRSEEAVERVDMYGATRVLDLRAGGVVPVGAEPFYLVSGSAPAILSVGEQPLLAPSVIHRDPRAPAVFEVVVRNVGSTGAGHRLAVRDEAGEVVWSVERGLAGGASEVFEVSLPAGAERGLVAERFVLELTREGEVAGLTLPLVAQGSHVISTSSAPLRLHTVGAVRELVFDPSIPAWKGPDDLAVEALIEREPGVVAWRFTVIDDRHVQTHPDGRLWQGDSVQVAFFNPANGAHTLFDLGLRGDEAVAWCHMNADPALRGRWDIPLTIRRAGGRTIYEAKVPHAHLGIPDEPADGAPVRFSFLVNDDDGHGRVRWMRWGGGLGDSQDVQALGHGVLK